MHRCVYVYDVDSGCDDDGDDARAWHYAEVESILTVLLFDAVCSC